MDTFGVATGTRQERGEQSSLVEFVELNRQRVFGTPALTIVQLERWQELRGLLGDKRAAGEEMQNCVLEERRENIRHATHLRVQLDSNEHGTAVDVSRGGIFIATRRPLPIGSEISLELETPSSGKPLQLSGSVVRIASGGELAARSGMAIMFDGLDASQREALKLLIEKLGDSQLESLAK